MAAPQPVTPCIRGAAIAGYLRWYVQRFGEARLSTAVARLPQNVCGRLNLGPTLAVVESRWYPAPDVHALLDVVFATHDVRREAMEEGTVEAARYTLNVVSRALIRLIVTPSLYVQLGTQMWSKYYDHGSIAHVLEGPTKLTTRIRGWGAHHPLICDFCLPTAAYIFETMGKKDVSVERAGCVSRGGAECVYVMRWNG